MVRRTPAIYFRWGTRTRRIRRPR